MSFIYRTVISPLHQESLIQPLLQDYESLLTSLGGREWRSGESLSGDILVVFFGTGGTEKSAMETVLEFRASGSGRPVFFLAHPDHNAFPAALEAMACCRREGFKGRLFFFSNPQDNIATEQLQRELHKYKIFWNLQKNRLGVIGKPSDWLVASSPSPDTVKQSWGIQLVDVSLDELFTVFDTFPPDAGIELFDRFVRQADDVYEPTTDDLRNGIKIYLGLKTLIDRYKLDAVTLRCFDLISRLKTTGCYALSMLNDEDIIAGCEGDIVSAVTLLWSRQLTGQTPWMANPAQIDERQNMIWLAHCTVPLQLASSYRIRSHFESGLGVAVEADIPPGPVTMIRIGGRALDRIWVSEGVILKSGGQDKMCRTHVRIHMERSSVSDLLKNPLGNHLVVVKGYHQDALMDWHATMFPGDGANPDVRI